MISPQSFNKNHKDTFDMETRKLGGQDGPEISTVGFGAWALGGGDWAFSWGPQKDQDSIDAIHQAISLGVNWIDTAAVYGLGHSETVVGKAIADRRDKVLVATKCGLIWDDKGAVTKDLSAASISKEIEDSLRRLNIDVIDLYQIHWPVNDDHSIEEAMGAISKAVNAGKIRYVGVSNFRNSEMERAEKIHPIVSLQPPYSMIRRKIEDQTLGFCAANDISVLCYSPMASGMLTGKYNAESIAKMADDDWRKTKSADFQEPTLSANLDLLEGLRPIVEKYGRSHAQLAIAWCLRRKEVTSAIVGARKPGQMVETSKAMGWTLSDEDQSQIEALLGSREEQIKKAKAEAEAKS
jgi:aryl-alcohol dehydrogenase-like predicted oxidoreductase